MTERRKERVPTERIIECLRETNGLVSLAAKRVPCSITTINTRRKNVQAVEQVIRDCRAELIDYGEMALRRKVLDGEPWAVSLVLKTLGRDRGYVERTEQVVTGPDGGPQRVIFEEKANWRGGNSVPGAGDAQGPEDSL